MKLKKEIAERREQKRFKVKGGIFAVLGPDNYILGQIKNISKSGLAFEYVDTGAQSKGSTEIEIFSKIHDFYLKKLPIRIVENYEVDSTVPLSSLPIRQLNINFGKISHSQMSLLDHILENYTQGEDRTLESITGGSV